MTLREILYFCEHDDIFIHVRNYDTECEILSFWLSDWSLRSEHTRDYDDHQVVGWTFEDGVLTLYLLLD